MTTQHKPALPVTTERTGILGKLFLHDARGNWIADLSSKYADEVAATLNDSPRLLCENTALREALQNIVQLNDNQVKRDNPDSEPDWLKGARSALEQVEGGVKP